MEGAWGLEGRVQPGQLGNCLEVAARVSLLEPEDLAAINNVIDSPLDAAADTEFIPSEIDELETVELPESK